MHNKQGFLSELFRYKKYGLAAGGVIESRIQNQSGEGKQPELSRERIHTQAPQPLTQRIDLHGGAVLGRFFPKLGECDASQSRVTLCGELGNAPLEPLRQSSGFRRGRGLQQPVHPVGACPNAKPSPELIAHSNAAWRSVRNAQCLDDVDDGVIGNLLGSGHQIKVTVNYGNFVPLWSVFSVEHYANMARYRHYYEYRQVLKTH